MTYRSLERANAYFYDPARRAAVVQRHGAIAYLSSGVNHLRAPRVLLDIAARELGSRMLIENYTAPGGALSAVAAILFELHDRLGRSDSVGLSNICLTVGATGALASAFRTLAAADARTALVLGLNYSFFSTVAEECGIAYRTVSSQHPGRILPDAEEACRLIRKQRPAIVVLSQPTNPSGELYNAADLAAVCDCAEENGCWLVFDEVPSLALPDEGDLPSPLAGRDRFPERLILIGSFSKSRSLAGLRAGVLIAAEPVAAQARRRNERQHWSPSNVGVSALALDMVLRALARARRQATLNRADVDKATATRLRRAGAYLRHFAPYGDDFSSFGGLWSFIDGDRDWSEALACYRADLASVAATCAENRATFATLLGPHMREAVPLAAGFNHAVKLETGRSEWAFVTAAFDAAGIDLYTETVFADHDDATGRDFWIRISTAVEPAVFAAGAERLRSFLDRSSG
ncbi:pyridoxal phosphate-dependent aminotransferase [Mangrovicella endophytica]|uniref:pyridoxal phosphate-dependent aminotransferase n=1 Tax=Mangrovicella endophytica TaxID=2066697 RepID=UPI000C9DB505|nr:pyridoxal phosphate-dependent aminotransferase [Mangrovicella endophytica]